MTRAIERFEPVSTGELNLLIGIVCDLWRSPDDESRVTNMDLLGNWIERCQPAWLDAYLAQIMADDGMLP